MVLKVGGAKLLSQRWRSPTFYSEVAPAPPSTSFPANPELLHSRSTRSRSVGFFFDSKPTFRICLGIQHPTLFFQEHSSSSPPQSTRPFQRKLPSGPPFQAPATPTS